MDALAGVSDPGDAAFLQRFFKTGPGQYGEGDVFIGVRVPATRRVAREFRDLPPAELDVLLDSAVHEHRLAALIILNGRPDPDFYLAAVRRGRVNNWDLVDVSADRQLADAPLSLLLELAASASLWERRVAMIATFAATRRGDAAPTFAVASRLLDDREDLMHKAVGWMLREVGKRVDEDLLRAFLDEHAAAMPRTALRYAIERFDADERAHYRGIG